MFSCCVGDSGGPLLLPTADGGYALAGVVSFGNGCADPTEPPGVYGKVSIAREFLDQHVQCSWKNAIMERKIEGGCFGFFL